MKTSKKLLHLTFLSLALFFSACIKEEGSSLEKFLETCPYELQRDGAIHYLQFPVKVEPNQVTYSVGDTLTVSMTFIDSIFDANMNRRFKVSNYPLEPSSALIEIDVENKLFISGFNRNEVLIDSTFLTGWAAGGSISADEFIGRVFPTTLFGKAVHDQDTYIFSYDIVLETPGRYILTTGDSYMTMGPSDPRKDIISATPFDERCPDSGLIVEVRLNGENNLAEFIDEVAVLDTVFNRDRFFTEDESLNHHLYNGGSSGQPVEIWGFFCFEVVE